MPIKTVSPAICLVLMTISTASAQTETEATTQAPGPVTASAVLTLVLESAGDIERRAVTYQCDNEQTLSVQYINAAPNFLAIVPIDGQSHVFATTLSASGARYVSGPYEWWSTGSEATLRDLMQDEGAPPLTSCLEAGNTP